MSVSETGGYATCNFNGEDDNRPSMCEAIHVQTNMNEIQQLMNIKGI